jgi:uncharacterized membrane protein YdjX (TVP38/TMEM64 family)
MFWPKLQKIVLIGFIAAVVGLLIVWQVYGKSLDLEQLRQYIRDFGIWSPLIFITIFTIATIFIPSTPFMAIAGILFGFKYGLAYTIIGCFISSEIVFYISRKLGKEKIEKVLENKYLKPLKKYNKRLGSGGVWDLIILRFLPILPFNVLNILMGVSKMTNKNYTVGTFIGLIPSNLLGVYLGSLVTALL